MRTISQQELLITVEGRQWVPREEVLKLLRANKPDPDFFADVAELAGLEEITDPAHLRHHLLDREIRGWSAASPAHGSVDRGHRSRP
jgi:hypothetical protein